MERGPDHKRQMERVERRRHRPRRIRRVVCVALALLAVMVGAVVVTTSASETSGQPLDPAVFADGSCMAFAPTAGDRGQTVFLDAGHGGIDPGGVGTTESGVPIDEATASLPVELGVMAILRTKGYRVMVSRTTADTVVRLTPADRSGNELSLVGSHDDVAARHLCQRGPCPGAGGHLLRRRSLR